MAISLCFSPLISTPKHHPRIPLYKPINPFITLTTPKISNPNFKKIKCVHEDSQNLAAKPRWENWLSIAASLYPVYVSVGGVVACLKPSTFSWFVKCGPTSYSLALWLIMLAMGLTLEIKELINLLLQRPLSILFGCAAQYTIMPALGVILSKILGLPPSISVGLILLACCPGGTASNVVTLIAQGDVPLSIVMTACTTIGAVVLTPFLTMILAGTYVPVDAVKLSISTLQVVVAPIILGSYMQHKFPKAVKTFTPFAPLLAVLATSLVSSSIFSENVGRLRSSVVGTSFSSDLPLLSRAQSVLASEFGLVAMSVASLHFVGFFVGYLSAALAGFSEPQRRAVSIEVGMQNSALGVVLATSHFSSPAVALPAATSAIIMNIMDHDLFNKYVPKKGNNVSQTRMSHLELAILPQLSRGDPKVPVSQSDKSKSEQLTILYAGIVHLYDNITVQKAESIMNLACESCSQLISGSTNAKEIKPTQKIQVPPAFKFQADLPIARRKSLKRFLEKRLNRIVSKHPYASPECDHDQSGNDNLKEKRKVSS